ncbi:hypothetical protein, partial [Proteus faecis]|uniref:hypothetical protein n=1 Tax=Proteus faecis TaxID=2050967 RepID=UPI003075D3ED
MYTSGPAPFAPPPAVAATRQCQGELCTYIFEITSKFARLPPIALKRAPYCIKKIYFNPLLKINN